jgi:hypothetical protein
MQPTGFESLLTALNVDLGVYLSSAARARLLKNPPQSVDACVEAICNAEGFRSSGDLRLRRQVREKVVAFFHDAEQQPADPGHCG